LRSVLRRNHAHRPDAEEAGDEAGHPAAQDARANPARAASTATSRRRNRSTQRVLLKANASVERHPYLFSDQKHSFSKTNTRYDMNATN
jgi:hypothetical protein